MNAPLRLPLIAAPPHDPKSLLLAGWIGPRADDGWRMRRFSGVQLTKRATLTLAPTPASLRRLTEPGGSFGGLRLPPTLAVGPAGDLYLLDRLRGTVLRFDPCCCRFDPMPCGLRLLVPAGACRDGRWRGGPSVAPPLTVLADPAAIAICNGTLYLADRGHARVLVFALDGWVPRGALRLPGAEAAALGAPWRPSDLAFDGRGRLHVLDAEHGRIDRFDVHGHWIKSAVAVPGAQHLLLDCDDAIVTVHRATHAAPLALAANIPPAPLVPQFVEFDGGAESVDWQTVAIAGIGAGVEFDLAVAIGPTLVGAALLAQLPAESWALRAPRVGPPQDGAALPLSLDAGRVLRLRLTPRASSAAAALVLTAVAATTQRLHDGVVEPLDVRADRLPARLPVAPAVELHVDADGRLAILCDDPCDPTATVWRVFDAHGALIADAAPPVFRYKRQGRVTSRVLDSQIDGCTWHRVELRGTIPDGCSVEIRTTTAPLLLDDNEIDALDERSWCTRAVRQASDGRGHDALILSPAGRYLVVELVLRGDGIATPCIEAIVVEYPRISLRRYLPAVFGADPAGADFTDRFSALFDATLRSLERPLDRIAELFDPLATPSGSDEDRVRRAPGDRRGDFLSWLSTWVGVVTARDLPEGERRQLLRAAGRLYCLRGTREGLWRQLLLLLGFDRALVKCSDLRPQTRCDLPPANCAPPLPCTPGDPPPLILEHYRLRRWLYMGHATLGADSQLWGAAIVNRSQLDANAQVGVTQLIGTPDPLRDPFHVTAHRASVFVPARVRACAPLRRALDLLLAAETPAHVQLDVRYVEPRFRVGQQAMLGLDSVIARTPQGVTLDDNVLGQGSVLSAPPQRAAQGWAPRVGMSRVGSGNVLS